MKRFNDSRGDLGGTKRSDVRWRHSDHDNMYLNVSQHPRSEFGRFYADVRQQHREANTGKPDRETAMLPGKFEYPEDIRRPHLDSRRNDIVRSQSEPKRHHAKQLASPSVPMRVNETGDEIRQPHVHSVHAHSYHGGGIESSHYIRNGGYNLDASYRDIGNNHSGVVRLNANRESPPFKRDITQLKHHHGEIGQRNYDNTQEKCKLNADTAKLCSDGGKSYPDNRRGQADKEHPNRHMRRNSDDTGIHLRDAGPGRPSHSVLSRNDQNIVWDGQLEFACKHGNTERQYGEVDNHHNDTASRDGFDFRRRYKIIETHESGRSHSDSGCRRSHGEKGPQQTSPRLHDTHSEFIQVHSEPVPDNRSHAQNNRGQTLTEPESSHADAAENLRGIEHQHSEVEVNPDDIEPRPRIDIERIRAKIAANYESSGAHDSSTKYADVVCSPREVTRLSGQSDKQHSRNRNNDDSDIRQQQHSSREHSVNENPDDLTAKLEELSAGRGKIVDLHTMLDGHESDLIPTVQEYEDNTRGDQKKCSDPALCVHSSTVQGASEGRKPSPRQASKNTYLNAKCTTGGTPSPRQPPRSSTPNSNVAKQNRRSTPPVTETPKSEKPKERRKLFGTPSRLSTDQCDSTLNNKSTYRRSTHSNINSKRHDLKNTEGRHSLRQIPTDKLAYGGKKQQAKEQERQSRLEQVPKPQHCERLSDVVRVFTDTSNFQNLWAAVTQKQQHKQSKMKTNNNKPPNTGRRRSRSHGTLGEKRQMEQHPPQSIPDDNTTPQQELAVRQRQQQEHQQHHNGTTRKGMSPLSPQLHDLSSYAQAHGRAAKTSPHLPPSNRTTTAHRQYNNYIRSHQKSSMHQNTDSPRESAAEAVSPPKKNNGPSQLHVKKQTQFVSEKTDVLSAITPHSYHNINVNSKNNDDVMQQTDFSSDEKYQSQLHTAHRYAGNSPRSTGDSIISHAAMSALQQLSFHNGPGIAAARARHQRILKEKQILRTIKLEVAERARARNRERHVQQINDVLKEVQRRKLEQSVASFCDNTTTIMSEEEVIAAVDKEREKERERGWGRPPSAASSSILHSPPPPSSSATLA